MKKDNKTGLTLKNLSKSNIWDAQENDIFRMWDSLDKDSDVRENLKHYVDIIKSAFTIEEIKDDSSLIKTKFEKLGFKVGQIKFSENEKSTWAIKKKPISRVTDLTYENIHHISSSKLMEVLERNFGGGWDSLSQSIKDIIESGFDISTTTLPKDRLHKAGGLYEKKLADGFEVLEIPKGTWVEAIFAKVKPEQEKPRLKIQPTNDEEIKDDEFCQSENELDDGVVEYSDDDINEDNYRTTFEIETDEEETIDDISDYDNNE